MNEFIYYKDEKIKKQALKVIHLLKKYGAEYTINRIGYIDINVSPDALDYAIKNYQELCSYLNMEEALE